MRSARRTSSLSMLTVNYDLVNAARRVIESALSVVPGERVTIVVDRARKDVGAALAEVTSAAGAHPTVLELELFGPRPLRRLPDGVREALEVSQASVLVCGFEDGEHPMRVELIDIAKLLGLRHGHMIGITAKSLIPGFSVDPARILDATRAVRTRLRPDSVLRLRTAAGADVEVRLEPSHKWVEHTGSVRPGRWENLPSGKLTTCPALVQGVFVADASVGEHFGAAAGLLAGSPVRVEVDQSVVKSVRCDDHMLERAVELYLRRARKGDRVGTVTIGTNVGLLAATGELICDLTLPGLHIGFGDSLRDQTGAAWTAHTQLAMTCAGGDVDLDGVPLLRSGRYLVT
jgi:leucyl aminopeptidase (aminopeptidase T)